MVALPRSLIFPRFMIGRNVKSLSTRTVSGCPTEPADVGGVGGSGTSKQIVATGLNPPDTGSLSRYVFSVSSGTVLQPVEPGVPLQFGYLSTTAQRAPWLAIRLRSSQ
jgi:hypothetical protein